MDLLTQKRKEKFILLSMIDEKDKDFEEYFKEWLINSCLREIKNDVKNGDVEAIEGLLQHCKIEHLANYLPEL